jgi:endonuclease I
MRFKSQIIIFILDAGLTFSLTTLPFFFLPLQKNQHIVRKSFTVSPSRGRTLLPLLFISFIFNALSQIPAGYYDPAAGKTGVALQSALHNIIKNHTVKSYDYLWTAYYTSDDKPNGKVWDMYSDVPNGTPNGNPPYVYTFGSDQCGSYSSEGDCYNREHSWPKSWFNDTSPMNSDIFHIYPTDGKVNGMRSNFPYGTVSAPTWTSLNGSKVGTCSWPGYNGTVFEPLDDYKGDFARTYFYMSTRYYTEDAGWAGSPATTGAQLKTWALQLMLHWSNTDPVSQKETDRNNTVYGMQHNRNPFIDHPEYATQIWGNPVAINDLREPDFRLTPYPNPAKNRCSLDLPGSFETENIQIQIVSLTGIQFTPAYSQNGNTLSMDIQALPAGIYFLLVSGESGLYHAKLVKE